MTSTIETTPSRIGRAGGIFAWTCCACLALSGVGAIAERHPIAGSFFILAAIIVSPLTEAMVRERLKITVPTWLKIVCAFALIAGAGAFLPPGPKSDIAKTAQPPFTPDPKGVTVAKLLVLDDFRGYLEGEKVVGDWESIFPLNERVTAQQLSSSYHANEIAADDKFKGKTLLIKGVIQGIRKDLSDNAYLVLYDGNSFAGVNAYITDETARYSTHLSRGDTVDLACTGAGTLVTPNLKGCDAIPMIVERERSKLENVVDQFLSGDQKLPERMRAMIGVGYAIGTALPLNNACRTATIDDMTACSAQMHTIPKSTLKTNYLQLSKHVALPPSELP